LDIGVPDLLYREKYKAGSSMSPFWEMVGKGEGVVSGWIGQSKGRKFAFEIWRHGDWCEGAGGGRLSLETALDSLRDGESPRGLAKKFKSGQGAKWWSGGLQDWPTDVAW
jgi:hypothetical protein